MRVEDESNVREPILREKESHLRTDSVAVVDQHPVMRICLQCDEPRVFWRAEIDPFNTDDKITEYPSDSKGNSLPLNGPSGQVPFKK